MVILKWDAEWTHSNLTNDDIENTVSTLLQHDRITSQKATYSIKGAANEKYIENISPKTMRTSAHRFAAWILLKGKSHPRGRLGKLTCGSTSCTHILSTRNAHAKTNTNHCEERKMINAQAHIHKLAKRLIDADFQMNKNSYNTDPDSYFSSQGHYCKAGDEE